jgi:hypothetical protein
MRQSPVSMTMTGRKAPASPLSVAVVLGPDLRRSAARETSGHCAAPGRMVTAPGGVLRLGDTSATNAACWACRHVRPAGELGFLGPSV